MFGYKIIKNLYHGTKQNVAILNNSLRMSSSYLEDLTSLVNSSNFCSITSYFIYVDTNNFKTNIFKGSKNNWTLINSYLCTIGKPTNPTIKGTFYLGPKGYSFGEARGFRCYYYSQIKDNYLFHSIPYYLDGTIKDSRLGVMATDGCVRLSTQNAKWIYDNIPSGSTVHII